MITVGDGEQAIARIPTERPDIVLADIGMPKRSGYEVAAFVKGTPDLAHIPVLLLAGAFEPVDEARARAGEVRRRAGQAVRAAAGHGARARAARRRKRARAIGARHRRCRRRRPAARPSHAEQAAASVGAAAPAPPSRRDSRSRSWTTTSRASTRRSPSSTASRDGRPPRRSRWTTSSAGRADARDAARLDACATLPTPSLSLRGIDRLPTASPHARTARPAPARLRRAPPRGGGNVDRSMPSRRCCAMEQGDAGAVAHVAPRAPRSSPTNARRSLDGAGRARSPRRELVDGCAGAVGRASSRRRRRSRRGRTPGAETWRSRSC